VCTLLPITLDSVSRLKEGKLCLNIFVQVSDQTFCSDTMSYHFCLFISTTIVVITLLSLENKTEDKDTKNEQKKDENKVNQLEQHISLFIVANCCT